MILAKLENVKKYYGDRMVLDKEYNSIIEVNYGNIKRYIGNYLLMKN